MIVAAIISILSPKKKRQAKPASQPSVFEQLFNEQENRYQEEYSHEEEVQEEAIQEEVQEEESVAQFMQRKKDIEELQRQKKLIDLVDKKEEATDFIYESDDDFIKNSEISGKEAEEETTDFNLKDAIIYSEILKTKHF